MNDEQAIRALIDMWMQATTAGDLARVLALVADDAVFLGPGRPPMRGKEGFAAASRAFDGKMRVEGTAAIQEIRVFGEWAYCWNELTITLHPIGGGAPSRLAGPALSILRRKKDGAWVIVRDANMVTPVNSSNA